MPVYPPDLYEALLKETTPLLRTDQDRAAQLLSILQDWPQSDTINWSGSPRAFMSRLIEQLPPIRLQQTLQSLLVGHDKQQRLHHLCHRITVSQQLQETTTNDPLNQYHQHLVHTLAGSRYQLDKRFVQLTLLLDQGPEATGTRFVIDSRRQQYDSLTTLLADIDDRVVVLLGRPGSGKTTLLRRLQLEHTWTALENNNNHTTFFVSLNGYQAYDRQALPPTPATWLRQEWTAQYPALADHFEACFQAGKLLLLLDGLNEIPHRDNNDYRERIALWQQFIRHTHNYGNKIVFSCRSLNYSAVLSSESLPVPQVEVNPLTPTNIETFLKQHIPQQATAVWHNLQQNSQQLSLFATPFFLRLLVEQIADTGDMPTGQAALLTSFVRRALDREIRREELLFAPDYLLSEDDRQQVILKDWPTTTALPDEGPLIPHLTHLAYTMQAGQQGQEGGLVRLSPRQAKQHLNTPLSGDILKAGIQLNLLDKEQLRAITFYHQLLQEYFAARQLAPQPEPTLATVPWQVGTVTPSLADTIATLESSDPLPPLPATGWEETFILAAAMTPTPDTFITNLIDHNLPLAARCAIAADVPISPHLTTTLITVSKQIGRPPTYFPINRTPAPS